MTDTTATQTTYRARRMAREPEVSGAAPDQVSAPKCLSDVRVTKAGQVLLTLQRPEGASLEDLVALTGWLPHTTRAALTGLRKKGHRVTSVKTEGGTRIYRVENATTNGASAEA